MTNRTASPRFRASARQAIIGILALPLSLLPFAAYATLTPEGRLVRERAVATVVPPALPKLRAKQRRTLAERAPRYTDGVMVLAYHGLGSGPGADGRFSISPKR